MQQSGYRKVAFLVRFNFCLKREPAQLLALALGGRLRIHQAKIKNFRLLADVQLVFEERTTVIVGRNNSGKTSLYEVIRRFLDEGSTTFQLEDFSSACYARFCIARNAHKEGQDEDAVRALLPHIELQLICNYDPAQPELGPLAPFVIDLDEDCSEASVFMRYELKDGAIATFFADLPDGDLTAEAKIAYLRTIRERIPNTYGVRIWAQDPNDPTNTRTMQAASLRNLVKTGFVNAQRGLDDVTSRESDVLAKVLETLFTTAVSPSADTADRIIAEALGTVVQELQVKIDADFSGKLKGLMPTLQSFGYPGLGGQDIRTETTLNIKTLLSNFTKVRYAGYDGVALPESYNGLGVRNLIYILLKLVGFYREFRAQATSPGMHIIFIEEPEAHLHPQMQEVFIRQLDKIAKQLSDQADDHVPWPVQFVVSTHSSHVANEAGFETIRYFLTVSGPSDGARQTKIKDLRSGMMGTSTPTKSFLHQYLTLTRCDLFFADKAVLVEGLSERLLLPVMISKLESAEPATPKLSSQYMTVMEVGGAYAHLFFGLLEFLELHSLIITDVDIVVAAGGAACPVHQGTTTSNACIKNWFDSDDPLTRDALLSKVEADKIKNRKRIAFQQPAAEGAHCGRTFEDEFILTNAVKFGLAGATAAEREINARDMASKLKKSEFALKYAIAETDWTTPKYILDGVRWLASQGATPPDPALATVIAAAVPPVQGQQNAGE